MSKDLLVLADEYAAATATFARALALKDSADSMSPIARDAGDKRAVLAEALAALDTAQPVQVNAMLLTAAMDLRHALSNVLQRIPSDEWPKWLAVRDEADKMITAAKQAQPVCGYDDETGNCTRVNCCKQAQPARPINCGTGHCSCIECPYEQAQPERAPLSDAQVTVLLDSYYASDFGPDELIRKVEQLHGIKQGGQHD